MKNCIEAAGKFSAFGDLIRDAGVANLGFCANDSLSDGAWRREVRVRDLLGRQAAHFAQRQSDLGIGRKCRVAARENEPEPIVFERLVFERDRIDGCFQSPGELGDRSIEADAPAENVDGLEAAGRYQPREGVVRQPIARPAFDGRSKRFVQRLLGEVEVADQANQCGQHPTRVGAVERFYCAGQRRIAQLNTSTGLTSMLPKRADGILDATCNASFRSLASIM